VIDRATAAPKQDPRDAWIGRSREAQYVRDFATRAAVVAAPVLITGESGTGKGLIARIVHALSPRTRAPLVVVNCAGVPDSLFESEFFGHVRGAFTGAQQSHRGLLEQANGGTLFLDEIGELAHALQAKLLAVLEDGELRRVGGERSLRVDARIIAATNLDLGRAVADGRFRRDLFHRLLVLAIRLPPVRDRGDDVDLLLEHFLAHFASRHGRPARGFEEAVLLADGPLIGVRHLPCLLLDIGADATPDRTDPSYPPMARYSFYGTAAEERVHIEEALRRWHGNKTHAARELGMARNTLRAKVRELGVADPASR
jgi:two-component system response regulator HydG